MLASEIRAKFLEYFERNGHVVLPSSSLVPKDDPTLLFTNAGMVQFKRVFLGLEEPPGGKRRAATSQKCVRAGGKHNDLEQVGHTYRHHTFFEMLGNFSFGDYFKRDAIRFGWEFVTETLGIDRRHLRVSVFHEDDDARALWRELAGLPDSRIYGLGERDNFWQMADTGPCGPCTEIYVDLAHVARDWTFPAGASGEWTDTARDEFSLPAFVEAAEAGRFLEIWNLVFMQYDRQPDGTLKPLPKPSVDTGAGLDRITAVMQGVTSNFHTDAFLPLIAAVEDVVGVAYPDFSLPRVRSGNIEDRRVRPTEGNGTRTPGASGVSTVTERRIDGGSFRVIADHARTVAFLLADGVFPSNEGRGYVLRRILRRAVRHAWLLGRAKPTLYLVADRVVDALADAYPELRARRQHIIETTRAEEERFLATIEGGMRRFDSIAPEHSTQGSQEIRGTISGEDAFRLYDTFGFPIDLTELMARERGYVVDLAEFERALDVQRTQSKEERKSKKLGVAADELADATQWVQRTATVSGVASVAATLDKVPSPPAEPGRTIASGAAAGAAQPGSQIGVAALPPTRFVGYDTTEIETQVTAVRRLDGGRVAVMLRETPFYAESGGQISDAGEIVGDGWHVDVDDVKKVDGRIAAVGALTGELSFSVVRARVPTTRRRDTERNHTATHLVHAALREVLGEHVHQAGSLVSPDRLRFDFTHHGPVSAERLDRIEGIVNRWIWEAVPVITEERAHADAVAAGAMALFGEKYGDVVRVVSIPGFSMELCGGTHVRNTSQIALCKIVSETGVAAGQRRIEAVTGPRAYELQREREHAFAEIAELVKTPLDGAPKRVRAIVEERRALERRLEEALRGAGGGDQVQSLLAGALHVDGVTIISAAVSASDMKDLHATGDALRERMGSGVAAIVASFADGKHTMLVVVTDNLRERGVRADELVRQLAEPIGGRGGGKPSMAQAGIPDAAQMPSADTVRALVARHLGTG
jgi:alanyl-tRNA synthetase